MDFISKQGTQTPFVFDKTLWYNSLTRKPGYEHLLGWDDLMNQLGKNDNDVQAELRLKYPTREDYINKWVEAGGGRVAGRVAWDTYWSVPNPNAPPPNIPAENKPPNYITGENNVNAWAAANNRDFTGMRLVGGQLQPLVIPPYDNIREWLAAHPNYRAVGFRGNPNNPVIRRMYAPAPAPGPGAGPPALVVPGAAGAIVPALPAANVGIYG